MKPVDPDPENDRELGRLLQEWAVPAVPDALDDRMKGLFRAHVRPPLWRRLFSTSIRVPLPVAVAVLLLLAAAFWIPRRPAAPVESAESGAATRSARAESEPVVTRTSLAGFEPVREMNVTVVPGGTP